MKITHMGVAFHGISWMEEGQRGIATFLVAPPPRPYSIKGSRTFGKHLALTMSAVKTNITMTPAKSESGEVSVSRLCLKTETWM